MLKAAKDADLVIDDNMKHQIEETLGKQVVKKKKNDTGEEVLAAIDIIDDESGGAKRKEKALSKVQQLKKRYD